MICLRCGYCCKNLWVIIVYDPEKGPTENNLIEHNGQGIACKHLRGNRVGEYSCSIHSYPWYSQTPCSKHAQIERNSKTKCRMGRYTLDKLQVN